jgi:hypothetical protein
MNMNDAMKAVALDSELEKNEHPIGRLVHLSTVTHAWRGVLAQVTPNYYVLDSAQPVALVDTAGPTMSEYMTDHLAVREGDLYTPPKKAKDVVPTVRIKRDAVSWLISW